LAVIDEDDYDFWSYRSYVVHKAFRALKRKIILQSKNKLE